MIDWSTYTSYVYLKSNWEMKELIGFAKLSIMTIKIKKTYRPQNVKKKIIKILVCCYILG
jgi:hypothetical protein